MPLKKGDDLSLRPVPIVVARRRADEPAVSAVRADPDVDVRIARNLRIVKRP